MSRAAASIVALGLVVAACGSMVVGPTADPPLVKAPYTLAPPTPTLRVLATVGPGGPGKPYTADDILAILRAAPAGDPAEMRTPQIAAAIADRVWTFDGRPYQRLLVGGRCDGGMCEISAEGMPAFGATDDLADDWFWRMDLRTGLVSDNGEPRLRGFPPELVPELDALARSLDTDGTFSALPLIRVEWTVPPPVGAFVLRYGTGTQEMDVNWFVKISTVDRAILSIRKQVM
ncbi:MAG TPA: hypothetical protein VHM48_12105 [Candidatus Limnocylindrales bacterium]|nr:hypothetical protein [Candidatus Limnocylindrales bacterium]